MGSVRKIVHEGREMILLDPQEYEDLIDMRDASRAMADYRAGRDAGLTDAEMDDYLAASTPLAYWRKRSGRTQTSVAAEAGISQPFLAQMEAGTRVGTAAVLARVARALGVPLDDIVVEDESTVG